MEETDEPTDGFPLGTPALPKAPTASLEEMAYLQGLYSEFVSEKGHYQALVAQLMEAQGRVELAEGRLRLTRDHMINRIGRSPLLAPKEWREQFLDVQYVGLRAGDACIMVLAEKSRATTEEVVEALNDGGFRFRTNAPAREVHGALNRQTDVRREGDTWVYVGKKPVTLAS